MELLVSGIANFTLDWPYCRVELVKPLRSDEYLYKKCQEKTDGSDNMFQTIGFDPIVTKEDAASFNVEKMELDEIWPQADYITVHTPLIPQTRSESPSLLRYPARRQRASLWLRPPMRSA